MPARSGLVTLAIFGTLVIFLLAAPAPPTRVFASPVSTWFEDFATRAVISPDGHWAAYKSSGEPGRLIDLTTGRDSKESPQGTLTSVQQIAFAGKDLAWRGVRDAERGWFLPAADGSLRLTALPPTARPVWSADGKRVAYIQAGSSTNEAFVGSIDHATPVALPGRITGLAWAPAGGTAYAMTSDETGLSTLWRLQAAEPVGATMVADRLDANYSSSPFSIALDGKHAYLALASADAPDPKERHRPHVARFLAIYELDLASRARRRLTTSLTDDFAPSATEKGLYWSRTVAADSIVVVPAAGGDARVVVDRGELPSWSPDGKHIAFIDGDWRLADWALNLDTAIVDVDADVRATSTPRPFVTGYHEDFTPFWSPDGTWIAFHSHRSTTPVPFYDAAGSADDIWLRRPDGLAASEIRLTTSGWEAGPADWSPDGRHLLYAGWVRGAIAGMGKAWIIDLDPTTGHVLSHRRLELPPTIKSVTYAVWSPLGDALAIEDSPAATQRALWIVRPDGTDARKIVDYVGRTYDGLGWSPHGQDVIYSAFVDGHMQLMTVPAGGGPPRQLTHDNANLFHPRVSPDGRWIAATRLSVTNEVWLQPRDK